MGGVAGRILPVEKMYRKMTVRHHQVDPCCQYRQGNVRAAEPVPVDMIATFTHVNQAEGPAVFEQRCKQAAAHDAVMPLPVRMASQTAS